MILVVMIAGYSLTLQFTDASGQTRTGLEGLAYYLIPHFQGLTLKRFLQILLDAISQLFFSLSVSMGSGTRFSRKKLYRIMIRYVAPLMMLALFLQSTGILA